MDILLNVEPVASSNNIKALRHLYDLVESHIHYRSLLNRLHPYPTHCPGLNPSAAAFARPSTTTLCVNTDKAVLLQTTLAQVCDPQNHHSYLQGPNDS